MNTLWLPFRADLTLADLHRGSNPEGRNFSGVVKALARPWTSNRTVEGETKKGRSELVPAKFDKMVKFKTNSQRLCH